MGSKKLLYFAAVSFAVLLLVQPVAATNLRDLFGAFVNMGRSDPDLLELYDADDNGIVNFGDLILLLQEILGLGRGRGSTPGSNFTCESTDPEIILQSYAMPYNPPPQCVPYESSDCTMWGGEDASNNPLGIFVLQNNTGGNILIIDATNGAYSVYDSGCQNSKYFTPLFVNDTLFAAINDTVYSVSVPAEENINIEKAYLTLERFEPGNPCLVNQYNWPTTHSFSLTYLDQFDVERSFEVVCHNFPPTA